MPADEAFSEHVKAFYTLARLYTAFWGTALILLGAMFAGEVFKKDYVKKEMVQILTALMFSFCYLFVQHLAYATPDITLTFFTVAIAFLSLRYLEYGKRKDIYIISVLTGIAISIKYPAAVITLYIALIVIYKCVQSRRYLDIISVGLACSGIVMGTVFVIAPNLFTDIWNMINVFKTEMRPAHLGADGLGFGGNLKYYFREISMSLGYISMAAFWAGLVHLMVSRRKEHLPLIVNGLFWVCLSAMALHWLRWGFPMYVAYILISASGFSWIYRLAGGLVGRYTAMISAKAMVVFGAGAGCSILLSAVTITVWSTKLDAHVWALEWCAENGVTKNNSMYEGYTPFALNGGGNAFFVCAD